MRIIEIIDYKKSLLEYVETNEGFSSTFYMDSMGNKTIGYGFNVEDDFSNLTEPMSIEFAGYLLLFILNDNLIHVKDIYDNQVGYQNINIFDNLPVNIRIVLQDMAYNLGTTQLKTFYNFNYYVKNNDFRNAALDLEHTLWYEQVGIRGKRACFNLFNPGDKLYIWV